MKKETLKNAWHNLWPVPMFDDLENDEDFEGFKLSSKKMQEAELLRYVNDMNNEVIKDISEDNIIDWMNCDDAASVVCQVTMKKLSPSL